MILLKEVDDRCPGVMRQPLSSQFFLAAGFERNQIIWDEGSLTLFVYNIMSKWAESG